MSEVVSDESFWNRLWQMASLRLPIGEMERFGLWGYATQLELDLKTGTCWISLKKGFCQPGYRWFQRRVADLGTRVLWEAGIMLVLQVKYR